MLTLDQWTRVPRGGEALGNAAIRDIALSKGGERGPWWKVW
jgi:hypothetical protein